MKMVKFDFSAPEFLIIGSDKTLLAKNHDGSSDPDMAPIRACRFTITQMVVATFPQGMNRKDGRAWTKWLPYMEELGPKVAELPYQYVDWLETIMTNEDTKAPIPISQWREAIADYLGTILSEVDSAA